jgi:hypothetical protein
VNRIAVSASVLALIAIFAALAVSVVSARRPLDGHVSRSFDRAVATATHGGAAVQPLGCDKRRVNFYACSVEVRPVGRSSQTLNWMLWLHDDGCWVTYYRWPKVPALRVEKKLGYPKGCTG